MKVIKRVVEICHDVLKQSVKKGDFVVDATAGNGQDTLFLADLVGSSGKVYSFDVQNVALENTKNVLQANKLLDRVELILDSHHNIDKYVQNPICAAVFNLGYLPGGCKDVITTPDSTISAVEKILNLLTIGGVISIIAYIGHDGGVEGRALHDYLSTLDQDKFGVQMISMINFIKNPPVVYTIEKIS